MPKQVNGFLASDNTFFEEEPECQRYEMMKELEKLCDTHETNFENFFAIINAWHTTIKDYYDADKGCKQAYQGNTGPIRDEEPLPSTEEYFSDDPSGDKDAKGFLEQSFRKYQ
jgi:hypothetical protein